MTIHNATCKRCEWQADYYFTFCKSFLGGFVVPQHVIWPVFFLADPPLCSYAAAPPSCHWQCEDVVVIKPNLGIFRLSFPNNVLAPSSDSMPLNWKRGPFKPSFSNAASLEDKEKGKSSEHRGHLLKYIMRTKVDHGPIFRPQLPKVGGYYVVVHTKAGWTFIIYNSSTFFGRRQDWNENSRLHTLVIRSVIVSY